MRHRTSQQCREVSCSSRARGSAVAWPSSREAAAASGGRSSTPTSSTEPPPIDHPMRDLNPELRRELPAVRHSRHPSSGRTTRPRSMDGHLSRGTSAFCCPACPPARGWGSRLRYPRRRPLCALLYCTRGDRLNDIPLEENVNADHWDCRNQEASHESWVIRSEPPLQLQHPDCKGQ